MEASLTENGITFTSNIDDLERSVRLEATFGSLPVIKSRKQDLLLCMIT